MKNRNRMIVNCVTASLMYYWSLPALAEQSSSEIKIVRDEYGMPHIYANDTWHLFYGYGYVVAQDRLFQMEMARRSTQGTVAEVLGKDFVKFDKDIRRNYWPDAIRAQIAALSPEDMSILQGYADGMNAWIDKVNTNPETLLPKQFNTFGFTPKRWEPFDVAGFAPIFPDICYHLTHYKPAAADIPVASDNPAHYADAIRYNARTPLQGSLLPLTRLVWA